MPMLLARRSSEALQLSRIINGRRLALPNWLHLLNQIKFAAWFEKAWVTFYLCAAVMVASLILAGGTRGGFLSDAILELLAIPLLLVSLWRMFDAPLTRETRLALGFCLAIALLPLVQLIPLPPWLWTALPNRGPSAEAYDIIGHAVPWMPISVSPRATWLSALSLLPPLAIFLGTVLLSYYQRRLLSVIIIAVGLISVFVGLLQLAQGEGSPLRFFKITNTLEAVGFFANRNHFGALLYCLMLFVAAWMVERTAALVSRDGKTHQHQYDIKLILPLILGFTALVILLAGELMTRSRAGLALAMLGLFAIIALGLSNRRIGARVTSNKLLIAVIIMAAIFSLQFGLYRFLGRLADPIAGDRSVFAHTTIEAAKAYMPVGSGLGTFVPVYAMFEKPKDVGIFYVNHAHNDILEVWLETGALGLVLMGLFAFWLIRRSVEIWRSGPASQASELDWSLARAATIVIALIIVHSFFDYPLRTGAMMAIMAFACALLLEPAVEYQHREERKAVSERTRHRGRPRLEPVTPVLSLPPQTTESSEPPSISPDQRWGTDVEWPKEWSKSSKSRSPDDKNKPPNSPKPRE